MSRELLEQIVHGLLDRPVVRRIVADAQVALRLARVMRGVEQLVRAQQKGEMGARKGGIAGLRRLAERVILERSAERRGKLFDELVLAGDALGVANGGRVRKRWSRRQRGFLALAARR